MSKRKSKQTKKASTGKRRPKSAFNKKLLLLPVMAAIAVGAYFLYGHFINKNGGAPDQFVEEKTLKASDPYLELLEPGKTGVDFQNTIEETLENNILTNVNFYNGGGLAVADINNDQLPDLYFINSSGKNKLYLNNGDLKFKEITDQAGVASEGGFETAVTAVDINADGFLDFYVCRSGPVEDENRRNKLFINNGDLTFTERAKEFGIDDKSSSTGANFFDYDNDGDLDLYLLNYPSDLEASQRMGAQSATRGIPPVDTGPQQPYDSDRFYRNDGGRFTDISKEAGVWNFGYGLSVSVSDFNHDGFQDVYVANDFIQADRLYINNGNGGFTDQLGNYMRHTSQHTMGVDVADFDNDAFVDIYAVDMMSANNFRQKTLIAANSQSKYTSLMQNGYFEPVVRNVLQHNNGNGTFSDVAVMAGVQKTDWSWSCLVADFNNDGFKDIHVANGYRKDMNRDFVDFHGPELRASLIGPADQREQRMMKLLKEIPTYKPRNFMFKNNGGLKFTDVSGEWMTMKPTWSCGAVWADLDTDGDLDLVVSNLDDPALIYKNKSSEKKESNYIQLKLTGGKDNPFAVGASVLVESNGTIQYQELNPTRGIFSSVEHLLHFGLGSATSASQITIRWPDGTVKRLTNVPANQRIAAAYDPNAVERVASLLPANNAVALFEEKPSNSIGVNFSHLENPFNDFEVFPLNPWRETNLSPLLAKADVNGDGLDDFFVGNAFNSPGVLYLQAPDGKFSLASAATFDQDKLQEDHGAVFFDFEKDGDLDLFVVSGGAEAVAAGRHLAWQPKLYLNNGNGNFTKAPAGVLPDIREVGMRVVAEDFDGDGFPDLFIGGRVTPDQWPLTPRSLVLHNEGGQRFADVTASVAGDFENCGMVTDLTWVDLNGDGKKELVVVGEWMPVSVFQFQNGKLQNATESFGFQKSNGLWHRLGAADLDGDGDLDLVTGNVGLSTRYTASADTPFRCYAGDFDKNGTLDPILTCEENGKEYPIFLKDVLTKHIPSLKKQFLYATNYAKASISNIWPQAELDAVLNLTCYTLESCWWENQNGKFVRRELPIQAQISVVQGILVDDFNSDGLKDILLAGNKYGFEVECGRCDASNGALLLGDGKGNFTFLENTKSGVWAAKEARDMALLSGKDRSKIVVVSNNNGPLQFFVKR